MTIDVCIPCQRKKQASERIFENMSYKKMMTYCSSELGISRTIVEKVIKGEWKPTFNKHKHLETLKIEKIDRKCID